MRADAPSWGRALVLAGFVNLRWPPSGAALYNRPITTEKSTSCCAAWTKGTYNCKSPGPKGVHSSGPLSVGHCPLCRQHRLHYEGIYDSEEEHAGIQCPQHICEACLTGHLISASSHDSFQRFQMFHRHCLSTPQMSPEDTKGTLIDGLNGWLDEGVD